MKIKYTYFDSKAQYDEAVEAGEQAAWKVCDVDHDSVEYFAAYMENILIDDSAPECAEEIHILVIDRDGTSSDDFREFSIRNCDQLETVLNYFAETREKDMQELVSLAWGEYEHLYEKLCRLFHVYESYHIEVNGELSDDEAVEAALTSTDGVREVLYKKEPLEITLQKFVWQGKFGTTTTADYYLEV